MSKLLDEFTFLESKVVLKELSTCFYTFARHHGAEYREIHQNKAEARTKFIQHVQTIRGDYERERRANMRGKKK